MTHPAISSVSPSSVSVKEHIQSTDKTLSIVMIAGESSADLHGAEILAELSRRYGKKVTCWGIGGAEMEKQGFETLYPATDISVAGLTEVLFAIPRILGILRSLSATAAKRRPDLAVLIDLPDFNLRLAKKLKKQGVPVVYYISPQVWAWRQGRVKYIRKWIDAMLCILPFEKQFYEKRGVTAQFVGHPLVEELPTKRTALEAQKRLGIASSNTNNTSNTKDTKDTKDTSHSNQNTADATHHRTRYIALLPGSRHKEITRHLPTMLQAVELVAQEIPNIFVLLPVANTVPRTLVEQFVKGSVLAHQKRVQVIDGCATDVILASDIVVVCSGTSTLQTALLIRPMVVVYRVSAVTYWLLKRLVKVAHIALVNLIADRRLVPELVQHDFTTVALANELKILLKDEAAYSKMCVGLTEVRDLLAQGSGSGEGTATQVVDALVPWFPEGMIKVLEDPNG